MRIFAIAISCLAVTLGSCGAADNQNGAGGISVGEAKALDEAAEMIEERRPKADLLPEPAPITADPETGAAPAD